jgi:uncharacterized iron-regulated membrane protein
MYTIDKIMPSGDSEYQATAFFTLLFVVLWVGFITVDIMPYSNCTSPAQRFIARLHAGLRILASLLFLSAWALTMAYFGYFNTYVTNLKTTASMDLLIQKDRTWFYVFQYTTFGFTAVVLVLFRSFYVILSDSEVYKKVRMLATQAAESYPMGLKNSEEEAKMDKVAESAGTSAESSESTELNHVLLSESDQQYMMKTSAQKFLDASGNVKGVLSILIVVVILFWALTMTLWDLDQFVDLLSLHF